MAVQWRNEDENRQDDELGGQGWAKVDGNVEGGGTRQEVLRGGPHDIFSA